MRPQRLSSARLYLARTQRHSSWAPAQALCLRSILPIQVELRPPTMGASPSHPQKQTLLPSWAPMMPRLFESRPSGKPPRGPSLLLHTLRLPYRLGVSARRAPRCRYWDLKMSMSWTMLMTMAMSSPRSHLRQRSWLTELWLGRRRHRGISSRQWFLGQRGHAHQLHQRRLRLGLLPIRPLQSPLLPRQQRLQPPRFGRLRSP